MADTTTVTTDTRSPKPTSALPPDLERDSEHDASGAPPIQDTESEEEENSGSEQEDSSDCESEQEGDDELGYLDPFDQAYEAHETFLQKGNIADLNSAIFYGRRALELYQSGHPNHGACLHNLAIYLDNRFHKTGDANDLSEAIQLGRKVLELSPPGHPDRGQRLDSLAISLGDRFNKTGDLNDLSEAIQLGREALKICPIDHPDRGVRHRNLATDLDTRFSKTDDIADQSESIQLARKALIFSPPGHPDRSSCLNDLSYYLSCRFKKTGGVDDLSEAIQLSREALELSPPSDPERHFCLDTLAVSLGDRFIKTGSVNDLSESIDLGREALDLCPPSQPNRSLYLKNLATRLFDILSHLNPKGHRVYLHDGLLEVRPDGSVISEIGVVEQAMAMLREGTLHSPSRMSDRLIAAANWRRYSKEYKHISQLEAVEECMNVIDESIAHSRSLETLHQRVSEFQAREASAVASDAAALALEMGDIKRAASFLERGRSLIFTQLGRFRQSDLIQDAPPELVLRFVDLSATLDDLVVHGPKAAVMQNLAGDVFNDLGSTYQRKHAEWVTVVDEIRQVVGLETFLRPPSFEQLQRAAVSGPVILVNLTKDRSDAIIILSAGDPVLVPLPEATPEAVHVLADRFGARPAECHRDDAISILREVWRIIVSPVVTVLLDPRVRLRPGSRIWWCPTGVASRVPLHAAGPYARGERNLINYFISSYTPTLGALIRARKATTVPLMDDKAVQEVLVVGQPDTPNERYLPKVIDEVKAIKQRVPRATFLESSQGTKATVLGGLREHKWIHLACHGHHNSREPFQSHFAMYDGPISLIDLIEKDLPHAELAVLSACHSARVSEQLPDEVLHPAAGMLFAGYKSVIGTMWALDDGIGSALADQFYRLMLGGKNGPRPYSDAAVVLAKAFNALDRAGYEIPFMQRINVVHYGV